MEKKKNHKEHSECPCDLAENADYDKLRELIDTFTDENEEEQEPEQEDNLNLLRKR